MEDIDLQKDIQRDLGLILNESEEKERDKQEFEEKHKNIFSKRKLT